jgi:hypothetical protein
MKQVTFGGKPGERPLPKVTSKQRATCYQHASPEKAKVTNAEQRNKANPQRRIL